MLASIGDIQKMASDAIDSATSAAKDAAGSILSSGSGETESSVSSSSTVTENMQKAGLTEGSFESAAQTQTVIQDKLLPRPEIKPISRQMSRLKSGCNCKRSGASRIDRCLCECFGLFDGSI